MVGCPMVVQEGVAHAGTDFLADSVGQQIRASIPILGKGFWR
jgi:hypothetical protein